MLKNRVKSFFSFLIVTAVLCNALGAEEIPLKKIELNGKRGGNQEGESWASDSLLGKTNVLIYTDPDEFSNLKQFVSDIESEKMKKNNFDLTFIVNTEATMLPRFAIRSKIKSKAKKSATINYVLDNDKVLVDEWDLEDNSINVLVLDSLNQVQYQQTGKIKPHQFKTIMGIINNSIVETNSNKIKR